MNNAQTVADRLEALVDTNGIAAVIHGLIEVSVEKAQHVRENWQDMALAREWERLATALDAAYRAAERIA